MNDLGIRDLFKITDFSKERFINSTIILINKTINELATASSEIKSFVIKAKKDFAFREIIDFISKINLKTLENAQKKTQIILKDLQKRSKNNEFRYEKTKTSSLEENSFEGLKVLFEPQLLTPSFSSVSSIFSTFVSQEFVTKILETGKNLNSLKKILPDPLKNFSMTQNMAQTISEIDLCFSFTNAELIQILIEKYDFHDYCKMIKNFFLFGLGDFYQFLFEKLFSEKQNIDLQFVFDDCVSLTNASLMKKKIIKNL